MIKFKPAIVDLKENNYSQPAQFFHIFIFLQNIPLNFSCINHPHNGVT